ncbi:Sin-like protein conserved region-domain-containing protein [Aspergillus californicus]
MTPTPTQSRTPTPSSSPSTDSDPVIASYDIFLTDSDISRFVLQYLDRPAGSSYDESNGQKPTSFRQKPKTGLVEVDVPINTRVNYDLGKGVRYGDALRKSRSNREGGAYGMAGGFSVSGQGANGGAQGKVKNEVKGEVQMGGLSDGGSGGETSLLKVQTLGGRIKNPEDGDPVYMLAAFRGDKLHLSPVTAVVQLHPQLHHLDAMDELPKARATKGRKEGEEEGPEPEARAIDVKVKGSEDKEIPVAGNLDLLKQMQDENWKSYDWVDAENEESWQIYDNYMMHQDVEGLPQLESAINSEDYLDKMSAPRIDPARPEMTGWAMKQNRIKQRGGETSGSSTEEG